MRRMGEQEIENLDNPVNFKHLETVICVILEACITRCFRHILTRNHSEKYAVSGGTPWRFATSGQHWSELGQKYSGFPRDGTKW